ncbi:MAG TPA: hypothetical protein VES20_16280, partial [Bryobacteraceae bacterium]|nr:hypothetical protein [Bryobacteraceae bacterium]
MKPVFAAAALGAALSVTAQTPIRIAGACTQEVIQNLSLPCSVEEPCPLFLEASAVESAGPRLVLTGNLHTGAATVQSVLLISDDEGRTWTEAHPRMAGVVLDQIVFHDFATGWISGHALTGVPRDAFLLLTADGGKTWRRRPISNEQGRTGVVEQFRFTSKNSGRLALDRVRAAEDGLRYEIWETVTGGESWNISQVDSRPLPFENPPRPASYRITSSSQAKVHRVERNAGG